MHYLYLDESGDLGHQIGSPGASRHFVITILEVAGNVAKKAIEKAIVRTMQNKIRKKRPRASSQVMELKATNTEFAVKQYFYRQVAAIPFNLYTVILDKARFINHLQLNPNRVYGFITHLVLKELPLEQAATQVILALDRSMDKPAIQEFNEYLIKHLELRIPPQVPLAIYHDLSHENKPLQAVDLFAWGIYRKYEAGDMQWYEVFREKIAYEQFYPPK
ncbi:DUF3800 domain-containing protein [candidate division KSB1 bacterium]|nr:DUF3800 domain-containing protein [candidate division KSB1 bacterium]